MNLESPVDVSPLMGVGAVAYASRIKSDSTKSRTTYIVVKRAYNMIPVNVATVRPWGQFGALFEDPRLTTQPRSRPSLSTHGVGREKRVEGLAVGKGRGTVPAGRAAWGDVPRGGAGDI